MSIDEPPTAADLDEMPVDESPVASTSNLAAAPGPSSGAAGASSSSSYDPRNDDTIFRPNGLIVFPRSDGDPNYGPPNTVVPPPSAPDVNYYHIFSPNEKSYEKWCGNIGADLAEWAGKPKKSPQGNSWRLARFPDDYTFTEQRKGPRSSYRTDPYLFGSAAHRFRSSKEFLAHAKFLLSYPSLDTSKCECKYCTGSKRAVPQSEGAYRLGHQPGAAKPARGGRGGAAAPPGRRRGGGPTAPNSVRVKTQQLPPQEHRPVLGITVPSATMRDNELMRTANAAKGEFEGYRQGELAWLKLAKPLHDPAKPSRIIDKWPAQIETVTFESTIVGRKDNAADPRRRADLRVEQVRKYNVVLIGAPLERGKVTEDRLIPFLCGYIEKDVSASSFGKWDEHTWLEGNPGSEPAPDGWAGFPPRMGLLNADGSMDESPPPSWTRALAALAFSMTVGNFLRTRYRLTDHFEVPARGAKTALAIAPPQSAAPQASTSARQLDDDEIRPGLADRRLAAQRDDDVKPSSHSHLPKPGKYWQGMFVGVERVWVGDVVRLKLAPKEVREMFEQLASEKRLARRTDADASKRDAHASYVMRIRAIYPDEEKAEESGNGANGDAEASSSTAPAAPRRGRPRATRHRIVGTVYEVMTFAQHDAKRKAEKQLYDERAAAASASGDVFGGVGRKFAFPRMDLLSSWGQGELPEIAKMQVGFALSPICVEGHEVVLDTTHIAGRLYPSLARPTADGDDGGGDLERLQHRATDEALHEDDTQDREVARMALAGELQGGIKAMNAADEWGESAEAALTMCYDVARKEIADLVRQSTKGDEGSSGSGGGGGGGGSGGPPDDQGSPGSGGGGSNNNKKRAPGDRDGSAGGSAGPSSSKMPRRASPPPSTPGTKFTPSLSGTPVATPALSGTPKTTSTASTAASPAGSTGEEPPLPPGWVKRVSRSGHGTYYANRQTKQTTWERPTA